MISIRDRHPHARWVVASARPATIVPRGMTTARESDATALEALLSTQDAVFEAIEGGAPVEVTEQLLDEFHAALLTAGPIVSRQLSDAPADFAEAVANRYFPLSELIARLIYGVARLNALLADDDEAKP